MEIIILAGGFGTRLRTLGLDVPKPMAPIGAKRIPFLQILLDCVRRYGADHIVLAVGYKRESIQEYFRDSYNGIPITYSVEDTPLLTGGAVKQALQSCAENDVFIINGDTYFDVDLCEMMHFHRNMAADVTVAVKEMKHFSRYGTVRLEDVRITAFEEKKPMELGLINGGIYCMRRDALDIIESKSFSFEKDFMEKFVMQKKIFAFASCGDFIDIGIPSDYNAAETMTFY
ncbi:nucleotidyltransferase family protein [Selenomonas noxia]|jgi:D-glycero-D-manno-heptose 1-phosphate guanosyltransferase|uniref:nucleotidyltransferase family protein n=1 Tax=Selenomonas noxia TaxID=135083 RepID=UPI001CB15D16|nr:nucleotidyltransferase family protein [Selenomonas noxia]MBF1661906.1 NTP transferase domain-containing protein [Selenomonas noxia]